MRIFLSLCSAACLIALVVAAPAQERRLSRSELPAPVQATADREVHGATVKGYSTEKEHGKTVYEVETMLGGHTRDLQIAADGTLNEVEEQVEFSALPLAVQSALTARAKGAGITKVESLTKGGTLVAYEAATRFRGRNGEIQVGPAGQVLSHPE